MNLFAMSIAGVVVAVLAVANWYVWETRTDHQADRFLKVLRS